MSYTERIFNGIFPIIIEKFNGSWNHRCVVRVKRCCLNVFGCFMDAEPIKLAYFALRPLFPAAWRVVTIYDKSNGRNALRLENIMKYIN